MEPPLAALEEGLDALDVAMRGADSEAVARCCSTLHSALVEALRSHKANPLQPLPAALRERLVAARGQVLGQRESVARAQAAARRAAEVLIPSAMFYDAKGSTRPERSPSQTHA